ncbi:Methyltransferase domain-containing protein [Thalassobaculum litoreum DSM 18839]|uniref:Methyltransferase domain-containing protein n=2 Tax=Thalassobaculaceae TaxID=2844864 RepID=A0A8G2BGQ5_9PROT|nr:Methyltransferase domain-containing protein [Thalassobaculum litoreum DSM 18839]
MAGPGRFSLSLPPRLRHMAGMTDAMRVFDRSLLRRRRERARARYGEFAFLEEEVADRLAERLEDIRRRFPLALELGARSGALGRALRASGKVDTLIQSDLAPSWAAERAADGPALTLDEEFLPIADGSLDAVFGALSLHWVNDLPGALSQIRRALKPDGLLLVALLGGETLVELRDAFAEAEVAVTGGLSPRVSPFADLRDAGGLLQRAGFALPVVDADTITVTYDTALHLMRDLRGMGETNLVLERHRAPMTRALLGGVAQAYAERFADADGRIPARFQILYLTGWAPAASQPKPLRPGSATSRLASALGGTETGTGETPG